MSENLLEELVSIDGVSMVNVNIPVVATPEAWREVRRLLVDHDYVPTDTKEIRPKNHMIDYWPRGEGGRVIVHLIPVSGRIRFAPYVASGDHWTLWATDHDTDLVDDVDSGDAFEIRFRLSSTLGMDAKMKWMPGIY